MIDSTSPHLHVNLNALAQNYHTLRAAYSGERMAAVVKANAYGLGVEAVAKRLYEEGCREYFVAHLEEAIELRALLDDVRIAVFHGVGQGQEAALCEHNIIPVLNSLSQLARWEDAIAQQARAPEAMLHIDTGMQRLGLQKKEWQALACDASRMKAANITTIMSHFACADEPERDANLRQIERIAALREAFPNLTHSFANSAAVFAFSESHANLGRPGCALYGINPIPDRPNPLAHVATLSAPILQLRTANDREMIGYGHSRAVDAGAKIATIAIGYADGLFRSLSNIGAGTIGDIHVPQVGRYSMDLLCFDVSAVPDALLHEGAHIALISEHARVDEVAKAAGTIGYELYARLGRRVKRSYE